MASFVQLLTAYNKQNTMNSLAIVVLCAAFAAANAGLLRSGVVGLAEESAIIQGPSASASIHGPDGSIIAANQPGGAVLARTGGVVAAGIAPAAYAAPIVAPAAYAAPVVARTAFAAPVVASAPLIARAGPAVVAHHGAVLTGAAPGVIAARAGFLATPLEHRFPLLARGSGLEGQYFHDYTATLYDNGQYHGEPLKIKHLYI